MAELRWNPLLRTWIIVAPHRANRPHLNRDYCPFCPGSGKVPDDYEIYAYPNDFPSLSPTPPEPDFPGDDLIPAKPAFGRCEVTLYSPNHNITLPELPIEHVEKLVAHWRERFEELGNIEGIEYVFIFENRGEAVGVTMIHPHGQIYAYPFIPLKIKTELDSCLDYQEKNNRCLLCDLLDKETEDGSRMVYQNEHFAAFVPPFAEYPYQVDVLSKRHLQSLSQMSEQEMHGLAEALKCITGAYDSLFNVLFPYMMCMHQIPTDGKNYDFYHFHIEFYPPMRERGLLKFNASSESGAWATINPTCPEEKAAELREKIREIAERNHEEG